MGHSRRGRAASKPGHVRYVPVATKFRIAAKCRNVPIGDIAPPSLDHLVGAGNDQLRHCQLLESWRLYRLMTSRNLEG